MKLKQLPLRTTAVLAGELAGTVTKPIRKKQVGTGLGSAVWTLPGTLLLNEEHYFQKAVDQQTGEIGHHQRPISVLRQLVCTGIDSRLFSKGGRASSLQLVQQRANATYRTI